MTRNKNFKTLVRARMVRTGESYTIARAALARSAGDRGSPAPFGLPVEAENERRVLVERWFLSGRLRGIPARRKVRAVVLLEVLTRFDPGRTYDEVEVSRQLELLHPDFAYLRRELVSLGYLDRLDGIYRMCRRPPSRSAQQRLELPAWEQVWLTGLIGAGAQPQFETVAS